MIIATRTLTIQSGKVGRSVPILVYGPVERVGSWYCRFEIGWPEGTLSMELGGADGVQALFNALQMVGVQLYASRHHADGTLVWDAPGNGYGFPIPKDSRDVLVGSDRRFYG